MNSVKHVSNHTDIISGQYTVFLPSHNNMVTDDSGRLHYLLLIDMIYPFS